MGEHPLVSRTLKGVFNTRPPLPRYNTFWDVNVVLQYIKQLGHNHSLSLRQLTLKTVMLLALTRPSRSVYLSKLDIKTRTFIASGVIFKPTHLSKQSQAFNPIADFFFPSFNQDTCLCPVETLKAYESQTLLFRGMDTNTTQTNLFLSWIGRHTPVSRSTIALWLRTCLFEAGIDTNVFKPHSIRGASCSSAALAGFSVSDILKAVDSSSEETFQKFYHHDKDIRSAFGAAVLSSAAASNLHVDMETVPSEM